MGNSKVVIDKKRQMLDKFVSEEIRRWIEKNLVKCEDLYL